MKLIKITIKSVTERQLKKIYCWFNDRQMSRYLRTRRRTKKKIIEILSRPKTYNFMINRSGVDIGYIYITKKDDYVSLTILIDKKHWGKGYGKQAMLSIENEAKKLKAKKIIFGVYEENKRAFNLYRGLGYIKTKKENRLTVMEKNLKHMKYDQIYKKHKNVWGSEPNKLLKKIQNRTKKGSEFLDLGCGQGRDALYMLKKGFKVTALDNSREGLKKLKESIRANNFPLSHISLVREDIKNFKIEKNKYSIINAYNSLHFLRKKDALKVIKNIKNNIKPGGYVVISCFTLDDPSRKDGYCFLKPRGLKKLFSDFKIIFYLEKEILDRQGHPGKPVPHKHNVVRMVAQKNIKKSWPSA